LVEDCPFCAYTGPSKIHMENMDTYVITPISQVAKGHVLVIPKIHVENFHSDGHWTRLTIKMALSWIRKMKVHQYNLITSTGLAASQSIKHFHLHIVPRVEGDGLSLPWSQ
jgi:histidine triad (HIT) family protein